MQNFTIYICYFLTHFIFRSSRPEVSCRKGVLRSFAKFTGKHQRQSLFLIKLQAIKKENLALVFSCEFDEISNKTIFYRTPLVTASVEYINWTFNISSILIIFTMKRMTAFLLQICPNIPFHYHFLVFKLEIFPASLWFFPKIFICFPYGIRIKICANTQ